MSVDVPSTKVLQGVVSTKLPGGTRWCHAMTTIQDDDDSPTRYLVVLAGKQEYGNRTNSVWLGQVASSTTDTTTGLPRLGAVSAWTAGPSLCEARHGLAAVVCNQYLYAIGGCNHHGPMDVMERISIAELLQHSKYPSMTPPSKQPTQKHGGWTRLHSCLQVPRGGCCAVAVSNRYIVVLGGGSGGSENSETTPPALSSTEIMDTQTMCDNDRLAPVVRVGPAMKVARFSLGATLVDHDRIWVVGGKDGTGRRLVSVESLLLPTAWTTASASPRHRARKHHQHPNVPTNNPHSHIKRTSPEKGRPRRRVSRGEWQLHPDLALPTGRSGHAVCAMGPFTSSSSSSVAVSLLVVGGSTGHECLASVHAIHLPPCHDEEESSYKVETMAFPDLTVPRWGCAALVLPWHHNPTVSLPKDQELGNRVHQRMTPSIMIVTGGHGSAHAVDSIESFVLRTVDKSCNDKENTVLQSRECTESQRQTRDYQPSGPVPENTNDIRKHGSKQGEDARQRQPGIPVECTLLDGQSRSDGAGAITASLPPTRPSKLTRCSSCKKWTECWKTWDGRYHYCRLACWKSVHGQNLMHEMNPEPNDAPLETLNRILRDSIFPALSRMDARCHPVPRLFVLLPQPANMGTMTKSYKDWLLGWTQKTVNLFFVCAHSKTMVDPPIEVALSRHWVLKAGPALILSLRILCMTVKAVSALPLVNLEVAKAFQSMPTQDKMRQMIHAVEEELRNSPQDGGLVERLYADQLSEEDIQLLTSDSLGFVAKFALKNSQWREQMVRVRRRDSASIDWVKKEFAELPEYEVVDVENGFYGKASY